MDQRLIELYVQRGRLRERIGVERGQVARELAPLGSALQTVDRANVLLHQVHQWCVANPGIVAAMAVVLVIWRPRAVLRTLRWGLSTWRIWGRWRDWARAGLRFL